MGDKIMDHKAYPKRLKSLDVPALQFIVRDAKEAMDANPTNPNNSYYADEVCYASMELQRRGL